MIAPAQRAWIFANGELADPSRLKQFIRPGDQLYAADGGADHLARLGMKPQRVIGDLDSLSFEIQAKLLERGVILNRYAVDKDETDLELALQQVVADGFKVIRIAGAMGGRFDQSLANLFLLSTPDFAELDIRLEDGREEVFLIRRHARLIGSVGDTVSLLPLGEPATGIVTRGLKYPLRHETLYPYRTRGISNRMVSTTAAVQLKEGLLICVHTRT